MSTYRFEAKATQQHNSTLTWHVAVTNPGREALVRQQLVARGIDVIMPMVRFWRVRNRKRIIAERPLLARTLVIGMDREVHDLLNVIGLERIVKGAEERWYRLPALEAYDLRLRVLRGDFDGTLREGRAMPELPPFIKWLLARGDIPADGVLTHKELRQKGAKFEVAA